MPSCFLPDFHEPILDASDKVELWGLGNSDLPPN
tara:strand:- start:365 stop:466 length:102 start_codon:yes stop_codon:yes gene_type:complete